MGSSTNLWIKHSVVICPCCSFFIEPVVWTPWVMQIKITAYRGHKPQNENYSICSHNSFPENNWRQVISRYMYNIKMKSYINQLLHTDNMWHDFWKHCNIFNSVSLSIYKCFSFLDCLNCLSDDCKADDLCKVVWSNGLTLSHIQQNCSRRLWKHYLDNITDNPN